jgi:hypothetical protein
MFFGEIDQEQTRNLSRSKRNTIMMLPSKFMHSQRQFDNIQLRPDITPSSADYKIERVIGKQNIAQANIKTCPQYSFSKSETHRTSSREKRRDSRSGTSRTRGDANNYIQLSTVQQTGYTYGQGMDGATPMIFHKTDDLQNPGVGDYDISKVALDVKR